MNFFKNLNKNSNKKQEKTVSNNSKDAAKERLHLVLMQDRANVSADFLELMKQEIIEVIKKYIDVDESAIDVRLTNKENEDGTNGAPALYANIPILNIKNEARKVEAEKKEEQKDEKSGKEKNCTEKKESSNKEMENEKIQSETITNSNNVKTEKNEENEKLEKDSKQEKSEQKIQEEHKEQKVEKTNDKVKSEN